MSIDEALIRQVEAEAARAGLVASDVANLLRFRVRTCAFPEEAERWLSGPMLLRELARALALRFDNASMAATAMLLDLVHASREEHRLSLSDVLRLHPAASDPTFEARPIPRADLAALDMSAAPATVVERFRASHQNPEEAWSALWSTFVDPFVRWSDDMATPAVRRGLLRSDVSPAEVARIAWRAGLHLRLSNKAPAGPRHLKGWSSAPRGFLLFDWLGAGPLQPYQRDVREVRIESTADAVEGLWSHVTGAGILDTAEPFASRPDCEEALVRELNRMALLAGNEPSMWPALEAEVRGALDGRNPPGVVQAGLWAARWLPLPYSSELRAAFVPLLAHDDEVTRGLAVALRDRER